ncbi:MAG: DUF4383 domain-containing protein [Candidatus Binatia bacterium]
MATEAAEVRQRIGSDWSPARWYLLVSGVVLLLLGGLGFALNTSFPTSSADFGDSAHLFGLFETNGWHNAAALGSGFLALGFAVEERWSRLGAFVKGALYVAVTTALFVTEPGTLLVASNAADQVLHSALAVGGIATGLATPRRR